jgi:hypothetical protein
LVFEAGPQGAKAAVARRRSASKRMTKALDSRLAGRRKRDFIKATVGFKKFGEATGTQLKSLMY